MTHSIIAGVGGPAGAIAAAGSVVAGDGSGRWSVAQDDFTATFLGVDSLTLGAFPPAMGIPISGDFSIVVVTPLVGVQKVYVPTINKMTLVAQVLTVNGAAFAVDDVSYDVICWGKPRGYDASTNANQSHDISPPQNHLDPRVVVDVTNETDSIIPYYIDVETYKYGTLQIDLGCVAGTVTLTLEASTAVEGEAQGAADYDPDILLGEFGISSVVAAAGTVTKTLKFDTPISWKYIKVLIDYDTTGDTGDAKVTWRGIY